MPGSLHRPPLGVPLTLALTLWAASGCGASAGPRPSAAPGLRHAAQVDAEVIRTLSSEGQALSPEAMRRAREEAVRRIAEAVDALEPAEVGRLRLDISIAEVERGPSAVRARCLVTVNTVGPPERTRSILEGAAAVRQPSEDGVVAATSAAVRAALRRLPQALAAL
jgi:hypothetical protein